MKLSSVDSSLTTEGTEVTEETGTLCVPRCPLWLRVLISYPIAVSVHSTKLRVEPVQHSRERNCLTNVLEAADPGDGALNAHAEASMRDAAELAQIEIPFESFFGQAVLVNALQQQFVRRHALRAADDFSVAFGGQHINAERELRPLGVGLHVKSLHLCRITMHHHRLVKLRRQVSFIGGAEITAPFELGFQGAFGMAFLQILNRVVIADAREGWDDFLQLGNITADRLQVGAPPLQAALHDETDQAFGEFHYVIEGGICDLGFDHPELGEMAASLGFLRAKGWAEGIDLAQRHRRRFDIKLARLRQIRLLFEIIHRKLRSGAFAGGGRDDRRIGQRKAAFVEEVAGCLDDFSAHAQDRRLALRAYPEMAMLHQKICAVFLGGDGVRIRLGDTLHHLDIGNIEFIAAGIALVGPYLALDNHAGLLRQRLDGLEYFRRDRILGHDSLDDSGAVAKLRKQQLPALAQVIKPAANRDRLAVVLADLGDSSNGRRHK